jgi:hypothetical protein
MQAHYFNLIVIFKQKIPTGGTGTDAPGEFPLSKMPRTYCRLLFMRILRPFPIFKILTFVFFLLDKSIMRNFTGIISIDFLAVMLNLRITN